jgi:hypothetical protein
MGKVSDAGQGGLRKAETATDPYTSSKNVEIIEERAVHGLTIMFNFFRYV